MMFDLHMKEACNDNTDTWISLAALTADLVRYLEGDKNQNEHTDNKRDSSNAPKDSVPDDAADIERRVRDILAMASAV